MDIGVQEAAAGASFGASAGSIAGLGIIILIYMGNRKVIHRKIDLNSQHVEETAVILKKIIVIAVPIIIGSEIMPIMNLLDAGIIMRRLQATGWTLAEAQSMYGLLSGFCSPLIAFPQIFTQAVAVSLVPAIAAAFRVKDANNVQENVKLGYRVTMIMAFPCAFGILALGEPIMLFMYSAQEASAIAAVPILQIMAISIVFLASTQTSVGVLQAIGKQNLPVIHLAVGCVGKVVATFVLAGIPAINVKGAAIGTLIAYIVAMVLNNRSVKSYTGVKFNYELTYLRPFIASAVMGICAFAAHKLLVGFVGNSIATLGAIMVGVIVYGILIFAVKAITVEEVETTFPGGTKIAKVLRKFIK